MCIALYKCLRGLVLRSNLRRPGMKMRSHVVTWIHIILNKNNLITIVFIFKGFYRLRSRLK
jgi:hypothetical protein